MTQAAELYTDRRHLSTVAYADSSHLNARADLYVHQQPPIDIVAWALDHVPWRGDERVVDVGCGPGRYLKHLAWHPGLRLMGLDLSRGMLADLERGWDLTLPRPALAVADVQALPLPDAQRDVALAMHMLYHVPDIPHAIAELRRVLRPGGVLLALTNNAEHNQELHNVYSTALSTLSDKQSVDAVLKLDDRFSGDNAEAFLGGSFDQVERHDVDSTLVVPAVEPILRYVASTRSTREFALPSGVTWDAVIAEVERMVAETITARQAFHIRTSVALFVCR